MAETLAPELTLSQILDCADAFHRRTGRWPISSSGVIPELLGETWRQVDSALRAGLRGLPGGSSLPQLLAERRSVRNQGRLPPLRRRGILAWADAHHERTGAWPTAASGAVADAPGETWRAVDAALRVGVRGLPGGTSLPQLLALRRGLRNLQRLPRLTEEQVLAWADAHHRRHGRLARLALRPDHRRGGRNVVGRLRRPPYRPPRPSRRLVAGPASGRTPRRSPPEPAAPAHPATGSRLAQAHRRRTGAWPTPATGPVLEAPGETWQGIHSALCEGHRGLPGGRTLAGLLNRRRSDAADSERSPLTIEQVLAWADAHHERTGAWPHSRSGPIRGARGETWRTVDSALRRNRRGLAGGWTLVRLLAARRGWRTQPYLPRLTIRRILAWADAHHQRAGAWPVRNSGPIADAPGETWRGVDDALRHGLRGLPVGVGLARLLTARRGARNRTCLPRLSSEQILAWAEAHHRAAGAWPTSKSGPVADAEGENWKGIDTALSGGYRGLPGGSSLARLLAEQRGVRNRANLPPLTRAKILGWAAAHVRRMGQWPRSDSGSIPEAPRETWKAVDLALRYGYRGLRGGTSLRVFSGDRRRPDKKAIGAATVRERYWSKPLPHGRGSDGRASDASVTGPRSPPRRPSGAG